MLTNLLLWSWLWLLALTCAAAITDLRTGLIPNWLTLPSLVAAPLVQLVFAGPGAFGTSVAGALLCAAIPVLLFSLRAMGGGDVKLFAAIGALTSPSLGLEIQLAAYTLALFYALCVLAYRGRLTATLFRALRLLLVPRLVRAEARSHDDAHASTNEMVSLRLGASIFAAALLTLALRALEL